MLQHQEKNRGKQDQAEGNGGQRRSLEIFGVFRELKLRISQRACHNRNVRHVVDEIDIPPAEEDV